MKQRKAIFGALVLVLATFVVYAPALRGGFVWDDDDHVTKNLTLRSLDGLRRIWFEIGAVPQYYPMVHTTFWLEYRLFGLNPTAYHVTNVLLHALNAILLWRLLLRLGIPGAWLAAAVFALHPVYVESVAWITERKNVLSAAFYLGAAHAWLRFRPLDDDRANDDLASDDRVFGPGYLPVVLLFVGALLSKTVTATFPAAMLLVAWWRTGRIRRRDVVAVLPLFALGAGMGLLTAWMERSSVGAVGAPWDLTFVERCLVAGRAVWFYAGKLFWPHPLAFIYPRWRIDAGSVGSYALPVTAIAVPFVLWALRRRIGRGPAAGVLFFGGTLLPALGFVNVYPMRYSFVADHFQYLASLGLVVSVVGWGASSWRRAGVAPSRLATTGAIAVLAVLGSLTLRQCFIYENVETLWKDTIAKNPVAWMAHNNLGWLLAGEGRLEEAAQQLTEGVRLKPDHAKARDSLGAVLVTMGRMPEAIEQFKEAVRLSPDDAGMRTNLGEALVMSGRVDEGLAEYASAIRLSPSDAQVHARFGSSLAQLGRSEQAQAQLEEALRLAPDYAAAHYNLGTLFLKLGRNEDAVAQLEEALRLEPRYEKARKNLEAARRAR